ncbi:hypothetical protein DSO57_1028821 [Entomophthora muscae]|uniref:Uncharacterized protein n=1 Tax=Entomophthora muscae TaxID=34485 RepID=A0ACC2TNA7_9FUNG|nr:hypothetical protein DSO57_1028821 [Entomophthora muscae]
MRLHLGKFSFHTMIPRNPLNIVLLGSEGVGKTSLLNAYTSDGEVKDFNDSLFLTCEKEILINRKSIRLSIQDSKGGEEYFYHRLPLVHEANVVLILFSLGCRFSFNEAFTTFYKESEGCSRKTPIIFVGCKSDLLQDRSCISRLRLMDEAPVSRIEVHERLSGTTASYIECSSKNRTGIDGVFQHALSCWFLVNRIDSNSFQPIQENAARRRQRHRRTNNDSYSRLLNISPPRISTILKLMRVFM